MEPQKDSSQSYEQMAIIQKYEAVIAYLYPIAQNLPRKHGVAREMFLECLFRNVQYFNEAGKTNQLSRLYIADAGLSHLRFWLRFLNSSDVRGLTSNQLLIVQGLLAETGKILGAWIVKQKRKGQNG
jgi:hypothetical protein